jgi:hypothetical protein
LLLGQRKFRKGDARGLRDAAGGAVRVDRRANHLGRWEVKQAKKWTEVVYAQVIGDRIVRVGSSMGPFGKRFGTDADGWLTGALRGTNPHAPKWEAPAWQKALQAHSGVAEIYAHEAPKFETKTGTHSIYLSEETDLLKRHCPPFNRKQAPLARRGSKRWRPFSDWLISLDFRNWAYRLGWTMEVRHRELARSA